MTGKKIRIALCISGEPRNSMFSFPYIHETFLKSNPIYETDVFIHSFKGFRALELYNPKEYYIDGIDENVIFNNFFNDLNILIPELKTKLENSVDIINQAVNPIRNLYLMFFGIKQVLNMPKPKEYDIFVRCRPDIIFKDQFYIEDIIRDILNDKYDFFSPGDPYFMGTTPTNINDQFSISNLKGAFQLKKTLDNLPQLINEIKSFRGEDILKHSLLKNNIRIHERHIQMHLIRKMTPILFPPLYNFTSP